MNGVTYRIVFRWKKVPLTEEQVDYMGSMGQFRDYAKAFNAYEMLQETLGNDWEIWINRNTENCEQVYP